MGDDRSGRFPTRAHLRRMLSLDKAYTAAEWREFYASTTRRIGSGETALVIEPKYDGVAISLIYEHGSLVRALTRGNGREGDDVTASARRIPNLPTHLSDRATQGFTVSDP